MAEEDRQSKTGRSIPKQWDGPSRRCVRGWAPTWAELLKGMVCFRRAREKKVANIEGSKRYKLCVEGHADHAMVLKSGCHGQGMEKPSHQGTDDGASEPSCDCFWAKGFSKQVSVVILVKKMETTIVLRVEDF